MTEEALFYLDRKGFRPIERKDLADFAWVIENLAEVECIVGTATEDTPPPPTGISWGSASWRRKRKNISAPSPLLPEGGKP